MKEILDKVFKNLNIDNNEFKVVNQNFYKRLSSGEDLSIIFGESYMDGEWKTNNLLNLLRKFYKNKNNPNDIYLDMIKDNPIKTLNFSLKILKNNVKKNIENIIRNNQTIKLSKKVGEEHYDIPDILYEYMLDSKRQYTCAYWKPGIKTLEDAQQAKINLIIDKLQIPNDVEMNILDIGFGWGGLMNSISKRYPKCNIYGVTISKEQLKYAKAKYKNDKLNYSFCDYREISKLNKKYDRIYSIGMFEAVGHKNYDTFFKICENNLKDNGIFLLHTVTDSKENSSNPWSNKYIFPGGEIPLPGFILKAAQNNNLMYHHIQNLSTSYAKTLDAWYNRFNLNWDKIKKTNPNFFTNKFYRMWKLYLRSFMVNFEVKNLQLTQFVFTKKQYKGMYIFNEKK
jgi:cyclopropane-fatty-acyl-phospholipid synthase